MLTLFFTHEDFSTWAAKETPTRTAARSVAEEKPQTHTRTLGMPQEHFETVY